MNAPAVNAPSRNRTARSGTVLIIVAGISALLMSLTLAYLMNMRADMEESELVVREAQARIVLIAGLQYIQEASRLGWDDKTTPEHEEAFGWVDVRDGRAGPRDKYGNALFNETGTDFPAIGGKAARFPLHMLEQPPFALTTDFTYNPAPQNETLKWSELVNYDKADPQPAAKTWEKFRDGDPRQRVESVGKSWFRVYREKNTTSATPQPSDFVEPATFTITCGAGGTYGFRDYQEAVDAGEQDLFRGDPQYFAMIRAQERILWFRTEWTPAVGGSEMGIRLEPELNPAPDKRRSGFLDLPKINIDAYKDYYKSTPLQNATQQWWVNRNPVGSILWIQRLEREPAEW